MHHLPTRQSIHGSRFPVSKCRSPSRSAPAVHLQKVWHQGCSPWYLLLKTESLEISRRRATSSEWTVLIMFGNQKNRLEVTIANSVFKERSICTGSEHIALPTVRQDFCTEALIYYFSISYSWEEKVKNWSFKLLLVKASYTLCCYIQVDVQKQVLLFWISLPLDW